MIIKFFVKRITVLLMVYMIFSGSLWSETLKQEVAASSISDIGRKITTLTNAVQSGAEGQILNAAVDLSLLAIDRLTNIVIETGAKSSFKTSLHANIRRSILNNKNFKDVLKKGGKGLITGLITNLVIDSVSEFVGNKTSSLAAKEFTWLALKNAEVYATSGGNPVSITIGQAMILKDVTVKNIEAGKDALKAYKNLENSKKIGERVDIEYEIVKGAVEYAKTGDSKIFSNTRLKVEKMIENSEYNTKEELTSRFLNHDNSNDTGGENDIVVVFKKIQKKKLEQEKAIKTQALVDKLKKESEKRIELSKLKKKILVKKLEEDKKQKKLESELKQLVKLEQGIQKTKIDEAVIETKRLKNKNNSLSKELKSLYLEANKNPNNTTLVEKIKSKELELDKNARDFIELRSMILNKDNGKTKQSIGFVNDHTHIIKKAEKEFVKQPFIETMIKKEQKITKDEINQKLKSKIKRINKKKRIIQNKKRELANIQRRLNKTSRSKITRKIDRKKANYLVQAHNLVKKYANKSFSSWSVRDKVKIGFLARRLGIRYGQNGSISGAYLRSQLEQGNASYLRNKYVMTTKTTTNYTYQSIKNEWNSLVSEIKSLNSELTMNRVEKEDLQFSINNLTDDINNDNKQEIAQNNENTNNSYWMGGYTRVYYNENNLGEAQFHGYGDANAETKTNEPNSGTVLYLNRSGDGTGESRTRILNHSKSEYFGDYTYTAWGIWSDPHADNSADNNKIYTSHWAVTNRTIQSEIPKQGSATYQGELAGGQWTLGQTGYSTVNGDITLNANFASNTMSGNIVVKNASTGAVWANASLNSGSIFNGEHNSVRFDSQLVGNNISNQENWHSHIQGAFGGNNAQEAAGVWAITKGTGVNGDERAVGVFRAKKQ